MPAGSPTCYVVSAAARPEPAAPAPMDRDRDRRSIEGPRDDRNVRPALDARSDRGREPDRSREREPERAVPEPRHEYFGSRAEPSQRPTVRLASQGSTGSSAVMPAASDRGGGGGQGEGPRRLRR